MAGQLTLGKGPDVHGEVGIIDAVCDGVPSIAVVSASVGRAGGAEGIVVELELNGQLPATAAVVEEEETSEKALPNVTVVQC